MRKVSHFTTDNTAQKAELALLELEIEKERAKRRRGRRSDVDKKITKIFDNLTGHEPGKSSNNIEKEEKGEAIEIVAKRHGISSKTLYICSPAPIYMPLATIYIWSSSIDYAVNRSPPQLIPLCELAYAPALAPALPYLLCQLRGNLVGASQLLTLTLSFLYACLNPLPD